MSSATGRLRSILLLIAEFYILSPLARWGCDILMSGHKSLIPYKFRHLGHFLHFFPSSPGQTLLC